MELKQRVASVVDYDAWKRGYMPPSEHILIDQLAYRGATVNTATDLGDYAFWIVTRGFQPHSDKMFKVYELLHEIVADELELKRAKIAATKVAVSETINEKIRAKQLAKDGTILFRAERQ